MHDNNTSYILQQLAISGPSIAVYFVGVIVSVIWISRYQLPSILSLIACGLLLVSRIATMLFFIGLNTSRDRVESMIKASVFVSIGSSLFAAIAVALLITAVFIGRKNPTTIGER